MSDTLVTFFNRFRMAQADIYGTVQSVTWRLSKPGEARVAVPAKGLTLPAGFDRAGGFVLIQFSNGLPAWAGIIEPDRDQDNQQEVLHLRSVEYLLKYRYTSPTVDYSAGAPAGTILEGLLHDTNAVSPTGLTAGDIWEGGDTFQRTYHYANILDALADLVNTSNQGYTISASETGGLLSVKINWFQRVGSDKSGTVVLQEGMNMAPAQVNWHGGGIGRVTVIGKGSSWDTRPTGEATDNDVISAYGYRTFATVSGSATDASALKAEAAGLLEAQKMPAWRLRAQVADAAPGVFSAYDIGDTVQVFAFHNTPWALAGTGRVWARDWRPTGVMVEVGNE